VKKVSESHVKVFLRKQSSLSLQKFRRIITSKRGLEESETKRSHMEATLQPDPIEVESESIEDFGHHLKQEVYV